MTDCFDLVIVGAGPGGSNAAAVALRAGLRVAQVDAARFPRVKPCAGGLTMKAVGALQCALDPSLLRGQAAAADSHRWQPLGHDTSRADRALRAIEVNVWNGRHARFTHPDPLLHLVCRPEFDDALVTQNLKHDGFTFIDGCRVTGVTYQPPTRLDPRSGGFTIATERGTLRGAQLIGADGAYSVVNRVFDISPTRRMATAVEVNLPRSTRAERPRSHDARPSMGRGANARDGHDGRDTVPRFDFGAVEHGYGWVFPKDDHDCIGLYTLSPTTRDIRARLLTYIRATSGSSSTQRTAEPTAEPLTGLQACRIPIGGYNLRIPSCPVYIVGDAAGFADALTGEGIYAALESGRLAGEAAVAVAYGRDSHRAYYRRLWRSVLCDTAATYAAAHACYRNVDRAIGLLHHPLVWRPLIEGSARAATFCGSLVKSGWYLPRAWVRSRMDCHLGADDAERAGVGGTRVNGHGAESRAVGSYGVADAAAVAGAPCVLPARRSISVAVGVSPDVIRSTSTVRPNDGSAAGALARAHASR